MRAGRGVVDDNQGMFSFSTPCRVAPARGTVIEDPCPTCHGSRRRAPRPRGAGPHPGRRERRADDPPQGPRWAGAQRRPPATCSSTCSVTPHEQFGRSGNDLTVRVPVTSPRPPSATTSSVPTLDGPDVTLRVKPGTQSGSRHRVKGKGITTVVEEGRHHRRPDRHGRRRRAAHLTEEQKAAVEAVEGGHYCGATERVRVVSDATSNSGRLRHLGGGRAGRHAPADAAHLRAAWARQPGPHRRAATAGTPTRTSRCCDASPSWPRRG